MPNPSQDLRKIDELLEQYGQEQFTDFVRSPKNVDALKGAVSYLVGNWPTDEQIQILQKNLKNPNRAPSILDNALHTKLRAGRDLINGYDVQETSEADSAEFLWNLSTYRPWQDRAYELFKDSVDASFGTSLYLISRK
jgi:hypothetical protein